MKKFSTLMSLLVIGCCSIATAHAQMGAMLSPSDKMFIKQAAYGGNDEIALSKVALRRSADPNIKMFAHRMIVQHSEAGAQLKSIAMGLGVDVPAGPDLKHRMLKMQLEMLSGNALNRTYINDMVKDHVKATQVFMMGTTVDNSQLRNFAVETLPIVQNHLKMAASIQQGMMSHRHMAMAM